MSLWSGCPGNQSLSQALALQKRKKKKNLSGFILQCVKLFYYFFLFHSHSLLILFVSNTSHFSHLLTVQYFILEAIDSFSKWLHLWWRNKIKILVSKIRYNFIAFMRNLRHCFKHANFLCIVFRKIDCLKCKPSVFSYGITIYFYYNIYSTKGNL